MSLADRVEEVLVRHDTDFSVLSHRWSTSSLASAHSAHVDEECFAKAVVLEDDKGVVLAVLPASRRLALDRLRDELGRSLHLCDEPVATRLFPDCVVGAIPPFGSAYGLMTVLDASLEDQPEIFFEAGDHETLVRINGDDFLDLLEDAMVAEIACDSPLLNAALVAREKLYDTLLALGRAIAAPVGRGETWLARVRRAVDRVAAGLDGHIAETESPKGILREIIEEAPRLWREVATLEAEHASLSDACQELRERLSDTACPQAIRRDALELVGRFERHRHRGADLVYEAFGVDIGGG